ncbi:MetQ/NlpA family ABC transporter substrate-binding protein [Ornithinimicrobium humiphilum]|uniref:Lipoprotein n=1 Tax=Ornithinimicrobium humiphilum TaxID=125288 RepID=A0A543KRF7_9MICO|nr:MetQ/NlpA family ABC transporter substrate-binding protein [Ornithinimicrobium humiphilum]TQM97665.1 D-methionine transport system substrate-binding protein [Ornithinimicrobium humiphilum]
MLSTRALALAATALTASLALTACGGDETEQTDASGPLRVAVTPVPHADILQFVDEELAPEAGLDLEIVEFTDYVQPNAALDTGDVDANYYQHGVFLADQIEQAGYDFTGLGTISFQPMGLYSRTADSLDALPEGATVAIPNDPVNGSRGLKLLAQEGLITLADPDAAVPTLLDVTDNPKDLRFEEVEAAQLPRSLGDVDVAAVPGNYALDADLSPQRDALVAEDTSDRTYANQLVVRTGDEQDPRIVKLLELLTSDEVRQYIDATYDGAVVAAF